MHSLRQLHLHTPKLSGSQALHVRRITGCEGLSQLFSYDVTLHARSENVKFSDVLGHELCVGLALPKGGERYFHGYVASFSNLGSEGEQTLYRAELKPHLWRLTRSVNCRIFQNVSVPEIVEGILKEYDIDFKPDYDGGNRKVHYLPWSYCVQYRETDFAFVSRLLEHEGMHYYFRHERDKHTLVLADSNPDVKSGAIAGYEKVEYTRAHNMLNRREGAQASPSELIWDLRVTSSVLPDRVTLTDYDFRNPKEPLTRDSGSEVTRDHGRAAPEEYEVYDHLETVVQQDGYSAELTADYARMRAEETHVRYSVVSAQSDARGLCAGAVVSLIGGPESSKDTPYLILHTELSAEAEAPGSARERSAEGISAADHGEGAPVYHCRFEAIDQRHPYRPARVTPKPIIPGPQSAIVAGPAGEKDVATDEWGRVFVKFHWARKLKADERDLSCWVRVSQTSAGAHWGSMFVPHIGTEVLVGFIEGDPDRPVVIGRVYNGMNRPPLTLPKEQQKSALRDHAGNELVFDGTPGSSRITIHSPSEHSALQFGADGVAEFTKKTKVTYSHDSESYAFGSRISYAKGSSWSVDRGFWGAVKAGTGVTATLGTELKISGGASVEFKGGVALNIAANSSVNWTFGREFKSTSGTLKLMSEKDVILDSQATVFVSGGRSDNTLLRADDQEMVLSFEADANAARANTIAHANAQAKTAAAAAAALAASFSDLGSEWYQRDVDRRGPVRSKDGEIETIRADYERISACSKSDVPVAMASVGSTLAGLFGIKASDVEAPKHNSPSAKIKLTRDQVELFAGTRGEAKLVLAKDAGISLTSTRSALIQSKEGSVTIEAKGELTLKSAAAVNVAATIKHRNMVVLD